jgi:hypothetical protein
MTDLFDSDKSGELFKNNDHDQASSYVYETNAEPEQEPQDEDSVAEMETPSEEFPGEAADQDDLKLINEVLEDLFSEQRVNRQSHRMAEQAADLVARYGGQTRTDTVFAESAAHLARNLDADPQNATARSGIWFNRHTSSAASLEEAGLIRAMFMAASRAGNGREAGLQAVLGVPLLVQQYRRVYRGLWPAIPALSAGVDILARFLFRTDAGRSLIPELPRVLHSTLDRLAWYVSQRRPITSSLASTVFAEQTGIWLTSRNLGTSDVGLKRPFRPSAVRVEDQED